MKPTTPDGYIRKRVSFNFVIDVLLPPVSAVNPDDPAQAELSALHAAALAHYADELALGCAIDGLRDYVEAEYDQDGIPGDRIKVYRQASRHIAVAHAREFIVHDVRGLGYEYTEGVPEGKVQRVRVTIKVGSKKLNAEADTVTKSLRNPNVTLITQTADGLLLVFKLDGRQDFEPVISQGLATVKGLQAQHPGLALAEILAFVPEDALEELHDDLSYALHSLADGVSYEIIPLSAGDIWPEME